MNLQMELPQMEGGRKKSLIYVKADDCILSRFNSRKTRNQDDIDKLAERIERNGFEVSRALWAYTENDKYEVFAGGNRLEAVRKTAHKDNVPIILYEGFTDEEISQFETQDNENDEYHVKVSVVDVWAEYARLRDEESWTQEQIARAKGVRQGHVSDRLKYHDKLPENIKKSIRQEKLTEGHLEKITSLSVVGYFSDWLTTENLWLKVARWATTATVRETKDEVDRWKKVLQTASNYYAKLPEQGVIREYRTCENGEDICVETPFDPKTDFVNRLAEKKSDTKRKVENIISEIEKEDLEAIKEYEAFVKRQVDQIEVERQRREEKERKCLEQEFFYPKIFCQSSRHMDGELTDIDDAVHAIPDESVHLIITSPPYNIGRDYDKHDDQMTWDDYKESLLKPVFKQCYQKLVVGGRIAVNVPNVACQEGEKPIFILMDVCKILQSCGFEDREIITWVKAEISENFHERMDALAFDTTAWGSWESPSGAAG
jgi:ParB/RepB/Spo0J family partition protein